MDTSVSNFPPLRACIFDMDGLLINTEELYFTAVDALLARYNHALLPSSLKPHIMGVPAEVAVNAIYSWAKLPLSREEFRAEILEEKVLGYRNVELLPGVAKLLRDLKTARASDGQTLKLALASSTSAEMFKVKMSKPEIADVLLGTFNESVRVLGDNPALKKGRGKPAPDIFLLALDAINKGWLLDSEKAIKPAECLVFEDSVPGVEAARRAGMRVVWIPLEELASSLEGKEEAVLAGRTAVEGVADITELGEIGDGWGAQLATLESFPYSEFGISVSHTQD